MNSPLKRIPGMNTETVRDLMDLGFNEVDELQGRSPEALFEDIKALRPATPADRLHYMRMCVYYAETPNPDAQLMEPWKWVNSSM